MNRDPHLSACIPAVLVLACVIGGLLEQAVAQRVADHRVVFRGTMGPKDRPRVERVALESGVTGWEIVLETQNPRLVDLDLYVYGPEGVWGPEGRRRPRLCSSEGIEGVETCRIARAPGGFVTVEIVASGGDGRSDFAVRVRPLRGANIAGTPLVAEDAKPLAPGAWTSAVFALEEAPPAVGASFPHWALYEVGARSLADSRDWIVAVTSGDPVAGLWLSVHDGDGRVMGQSETPGPYQDLRVAGGARERVFVLVTIVRATPGRRPAPSAEIGVFRADAPIPVRRRAEDAERRTEEWIASGREGRAYELRLEEGETAIIELEGTTGQLSVMSPAGGPVPVKRIFGSAQQLAWIGDPLGQSRHVLVGLTAGRSLVVEVAAPRDTLRYRQAARWTLHIHSRRTQPNHLVQFGMGDVERWDDWWTTPAATRAGMLEAGGLKILELPPPPDVNRGAAAQQNLGRPTSEQGVVLFAGLVGEAAGQLFDLAVCTRDGGVLDIAGSAVRWEWLPETGPLYLAIFSDPWSSTQHRGPFQVELTRSLLEGKR